MSIAPPPPPQFLQLNGHVESFNAILRREFLNLFDEISPNTSTPSTKPSRTSSMTTIITVPAKA